MSAQEVAISVQSVSKDFILPHEKSNSIKSVFTGLYKGRGRTKETQHALKNISFEVRKGEFFGIVGRNGSGKSTLLKILAGIYQPNAGEVFSEGKLVPFIELGVGFNPELSGRDNVYLNGAMLGFSQKEVEDMYEDIVGFAELERFMDQKLKNYSSGMQVRLAFSMAVRANADILLIDEVLAVGDADFQRKCYEYFRKLKREKKTVVFVSHDMAAVREFCDKAILIENNELIDAGTPNAIASQYTRLFMETKDSQAKDSGGERWGQGNVTVKQAKVVKDTLIDQDPQVTLKVTLEAQAQNEALMTGFTVRNSAGQLIHGTNTWTENKKLPSIQPGQSCEVTWEFPNFYNDGQYVVDLYVYGQDNVIYEQWDDALTFKVKREAKTPFLASVPVKISAKRT